MGNQRKEKTPNVEERIKETWDKVVTEDKYPTIAAFSKLAGISPSTLYHNYKDWAKKIADRRDRKHGKKKKSPVTQSRKYEDLRQAKEQIKILQTQNHKLSKRAEEAEAALAKLRIENEKMNEVQKQNEFILGGFNYLITQLQMAGVKQEKIRTIWNAFEKNILPVKNH